MIFDNTVVNDCDTVVNDVRVGIDDRRLAMGRPACMGDTGAALYGCRKLGLFEC